MAEDNMHSLAAFIAHTRAAVKATFARVMRAKTFERELCPVCQSGHITVFYEKGDKAA